MLYLCHALSDMVLMKNIWVNRQENSPPKIKKSSWLIHPLYWACGDSLNSFNRFKLYPDFYIPKKTTIVPITSILKVLKVLWPEVRNGNALPKSSKGRCNVKNNKVCYYSELTTNKDKRLSLLRIFYNL